MAKLHSYYVIYICMGRWQVLSPYCLVVSNLAEVLKLEDTTTVNTRVKRFRLVLGLGSCRKGGHDNPEAVEISRRGYQVPGAAANGQRSPAPEPTRPTWARTHPAIRRPNLFPVGVRARGQRKDHRRQLGGGGRGVTRPEGTSWGGGN